jgi:hypothetical protein
MKEACSLNLDGVDRVVPDAIFVGSRDLGARHQINVLRRHSPKKARALKKSPIPLRAYVSSKAAKKPRKKIAKKKKAKR